MKHLSIIALVACSLFISCSGDPQPDTSTTWAVLLDVSGVREKPQERQAYAEYLARVFDRIQPGDAMVVALITELSVAEPHMLIEQRFPVFEPTTDNPMYLEAEQKKFDEEHKGLKEQLQQQATSFVLNNDRIAQRTDIITACHVAAKVLANHASAYRKLVIISDMEEYDGQYDFIHTRLDPEQIRKIVDKEKNSARGLPRLNGVEVYVAGARSKDSQRFFNIRAFWQNYLEACGATLRDEHYGADLTIN